MDSTCVATIHVNVAPSMHALVTQQKPHGDNFEIHPKVEEPLMLNVSKSMCYQHSRHDRHNGQHMPGHKFDINHTSKLRLSIVYVVHVVWLLS